MDTTPQDFDEEWEEWDGKSPFWHHCLAGSLAGVTEHGLVYPLDTVRTHIQVCAACDSNNIANNVNATLKNGATGAVASSSSSTSPFHTSTRPAASGLVRGSTMTANPTGMWQTIRYLMSQPLVAEAAAATDTATAATNVAKKQLQQTQTAGITRLWRGIQTIWIGCIPAHALYFSSYEIVKAATLDPKTGEVTTYGSMLAGAAAVTGHDVILAPLDTVKQRLQLGHYRGLSHALTTILQSEGWTALFRSFPVTLATNIPYGMVMVGTNEFLKREWTNPESGGELTIYTTLAASSVAGLAASAVTTPLDRIKTYLQTQQLKPACAAAAPPDHCPLLSKQQGVVVKDWQQAATRIYKTEGMIGFYRGLLPRILSHTPAVAISWTTYETAKKYLKTFDF